MPTHPVILAIDYGTTRIGLAIARGPLAEPLTIIPNKPQAFEQIKEICKAEGVTHLIIGLSEQVMAEKTKAFVELLVQIVPLPYEFVDETLSSQTVQRKLHAARVKQSRRRQPIDHLAAAEFLQEWLDTQN